MVCLSVDCCKVSIIQELKDCVYGVSECGLLEGWYHGGNDRLCVWCVRVRIVGRLASWGS